MELGRRGRARAGRAVARKAQGQDGVGGLSRRAGSGRSALGRAAGLGRGQPLRGRARGQQAAGTHRAPVCHGGGPLLKVDLPAVLLVHLQA